MLNVLFSGKKFCFKGWKLLDITWHYLGIVATLFRPSEFETQKIFFFSRGAPRNNIKIKQNIRLERKYGKATQIDIEGAVQTLWHRRYSFWRIVIWKLILLSCKYSFCLVFIDINECVTKEHNCHKDASCANIKGSWDCFCNQGYNGNGTHCEGMN